MTISWVHKANQNESKQVSRDHSSKGLYFWEFFLLIHKLYLYLHKYTIFMRFYEYCLSYIINLSAIWSIYNNMHVWPFLYHFPGTKIHVFFFFVALLWAPKRLCDLVTPTLGDPRRDHNEGHAQLQQPCNLNTAKRETDGVSKSFPIHRYSLGSKSKLPRM